MPKPWCADQLVATMPLPQAAALILAVKLPETLSYQDAARRGDFDGVHDIRIGAKRLREALRVFRTALPDRHRRVLLPLVDQLNDALGLVRDHDVFIKRFQRIMRNDPRAGVLQELVDHLSTERRKRHRDLLNTLDDLERKGLVKVHEAALKELVGMTGEGPSVLDFAATAINQRLVPVVDNMHIVLCPLDIEAFHRQRLRVKRLKYALELFLPILPVEAERSKAELARLQELMGGVHDMDVQKELVVAWEKSQGSSPGLSVAMDYLDQRRRELKYAAKLHAELLETVGFETRLRQTLRLV